MRTTLDLPDDWAAELQRRAARDGREFGAEMLDVLRKGLSVPTAGEPPVAAAPRITKDPVTGLPLIEGAPDAPISRMSSEEIYSLIHQTQEEEDLARFGISLRR